MLADRPNLLEAIVTNNVRVVIYDRRTRSQADARITQAPEVEAGETGCSPTALGCAGPRCGGGEGLVIAPDPTTDPKDGPAPLCKIVLIHEFAHIVDYAYRLEPGGQEFYSRIKNGYRVAMSAGLWRGHYASSSDNEYWAEMFRFLGQARFGTVQSRPEAKLSCWKKCGLRESFFALSSMLR